MKLKTTFGLTSAAAAMSAVVLSTVLPSPAALAQPATAPATGTPKPAAPKTPAPAPAPAPAKAASTASVTVKANATATATALSTEDMVKQANDEVFRSIVERNATLYDERVADDAVLVGFGPGITSKFKAFPNDPTDPKIETHRVNNMRVKLEGNTAVVVGRFWVKMAGSGKPSQSTADFMNVFAKRDNRWQLIASHLNMSNP